MNEFVFVLNNSLVIFVSVLLAGILYNRNMPWRRLLAAMITFPVIILLTVLAAASMGLLKPLICSGILTMIFATLLVIGHLQAKPKLTQLSLQPLPIKFWPIIVLVSVAAGMLIGRFVLTGVHYAPDGLSYHGIFVARWITEAKACITQTRGMAYYPFNSDVISLWQVLPFNNDALVSLVGCLWFIFAAIVVFVLVKSLTKSPLSASFAAIITILASPIQQAAKSFAATDLAGSVMILLALAITLHKQHDDHPGDRFTTAAFAGLAAGFAVGCKVSFISVCFILFTWFLISNAKKVSWIYGLKIAGIFIAAVLVTGGYWYAQNFYLTGNPLFPVAIGPFSGPVTAESLAPTKLTWQIMQDPANRDMWRYIIMNYTRWPLTLFILATIGYLRGSILLAAGIVRKKFSAESLITIVGLTMLFSYPMMPFSGTNVGAPGLRADNRFVIVQFILGAVLFVPLIRGKHFGYFWLSIASIAVIFRYGFDLENILVGAAIIFVGVIIALSLRPEKNKPIAVAAAKLCLLIGLPGFLAGISYFHGFQDEITTQRIIETGKHWYPLGSQSPGSDSWHFLSELPDGATVTWFGSINTWYYYPYFGRDLTLNPIEVADDGKKLDKYHVYWKQQPEKIGDYRLLKDSEIFDKWHISTKSTSLENLVENLIDSEVDYVFTVKNARGQWPAQASILGSSKRAEKVLQTKYSMVWRLKHRYDR